MLSKIQVYSVHSEIKCRHVKLQYISLYTYILKDHIVFSHIHRRRKGGGGGGARGAVAPTWGHFFYIKILKEEGRSDQSAPHPSLGAKMPICPTPSPPLA